MMRNKLTKWDTSVSHSVLLWWAIAFPGITLLALRLGSLFQPDAWIALTSGCEEEALFSIWKFAKGFPVYTPLMEIPFSGSYFNLLFYEVYGTAAKIALQIGFQDSIIPLLGHFLTLLFTLGVVLLVWRILIDSCRKISSPFTKWTLLALALIVVINSLSGWWAITTRPDIGALFLETAGVLGGVHYLKNQRISILLVTACCFCLSFGFRQTNISGALSFFILIAITRPLHAAIYATTGAIFLGVLVTISPENYFENTVDHIFALPFLHHTMIKNLTNAIVKFPPIVIAILLSLYDVKLWIKKYPFNFKPTIQGFFCLYCIGSFSLNLLCSAKDGAAENYYFSAMISAGLYIIYRISYINGSDQGSLISKVLQISLAAPSFVCLLPLLGITGKIDQNDTSKKIKEVCTLLADLDGKIFCTERSLNLPWINPSRPSFVYAFIYRGGTFMNVDYDHGGIEGLINNQYFDYVLVSKDTYSVFNHLPTQAGYKLLEERSTTQLWQSPQKHNK